MSIQGNLTCANALWLTSLTVTTGTRAKMLVDHSPSALTLPDSSVYPATMPQITRGGQRVIGGSISSTDGSAKDVLVYRGSTLTTQSTAATGALAVATTSTITRASGDFRLDGWTIGDSLMIFGAPPSTFGGRGTPDHSNNAGTLAALSSAGVMAIITAMTATTLTVNGTPLSVESLPSCRLIRVSLAYRGTIAAGSGNAAATPSVALLGTSNEADVTNQLAADRGLSLGERDVLLIAAQAAVSALPAQINANALSVLF